MLKPYRRHLAACKHAARGSGFSRCDCPVWVDGFVFGRRIRHSLDTTDWGVALDRIRAIERNPAGDEWRHTRITVATAVALYLDDCSARGLRPETMRSYRRILDCFAKANRCSLDECSKLRVADFRASRAVASTTARKELETLRCFFRFCVDRGFLQKSPADGIKHRIVRSPGSLPFTEDEVSKLLSAVETFYRDGLARQRARALLHVFLATGLRVSDVIQLHPSQLVDRHLTIAKTTKTDAAVKVLLPEAVLTMLGELPLTHPGGRYFWSGEGSVQVAAGNCRRTLARIGRIAGVHCHPHRFRDTFACRLLAAGADIRTVSKLLGHRSVIVTERHYAHFVISHQKILDAAVLRLFSTPQKP